MSSLSDSSPRGDGRTFSPELSGSPPATWSSCPTVDLSSSLSGARGAAGMWACSEVELGLSLSARRSCTQREGCPGPRRLAPYQKKPAGNPGGHGLTELVNLDRVLAREVDLCRRVRLVAACDTKWPMPRSG